MTAAHFLTVLYASVFGGPMFEAFGEDGPEARCYHFVAVSTDKGTFVYREGFEDQRDANRLATRVEERGSIDPQYWVTESPWDGIRAEVAEANRLAAMGATEEELERWGLA